MLVQQNKSLEKLSRMDTVKHLDVTASVAIMFLLPFIIISKIALKRTKKIPHIAKFLLKGLLTFDFMANLCFLFEFVVANEIASRLFVLIGAGFAGLSYITVAMLSIDRLIAFQFPYRYLNLFVQSPYKIQRISVISWSAVFLSHVIHRLVLCSSEYTTTNINVAGSEFEDCSFIIKWSSNSIGITSMTIIISLVCYIQIFKIVKRQARLTSRRAKHILRQYKTVTVIVVYMINIVATATVYSCLAIASVDQKYLKTTVKCVILLNGVFNSCAYVLWFKECQMEFLKLFLWCIPSLKKKTDTMKLDIYFIPTIEKKHTVKTNGEILLTA